MDNFQVNQFYEWISPLAKRDSIEIDLHGSHSRQNKIFFQKESLKNQSSSEDRHLNLRVLQGEKSGTSYTKDFSKTSIEECYKQAINSLKLSDKQERGSLSQNEKYRDFSSFHSRDFSKIPIEEKLQKVQEMNISCFEYNKNVQSMYSVVSDIDSYSFFVNSKSAQSFYRKNDVSAFNYSLAVKDKKRSEGSDIKNARNYKDIDFKKLGQISAERALKKLNYVIPETKRYPVIFQAGQAAASLLSSLVNLMNGKLVFEDLSLLKNCLNKKIFSENVSIYDDPFASWGRGSVTFDGEGFACEKTSLIENGVLKNYLTSSFFAKALKVPHTKKASWDTLGNLDISQSNLIMGEGIYSFKDLIEEFPQVIVVDRLKGFSGYNAISGDFSIESEGFLWAGGEAKPICQFTVSGNIKELFSRVLKIAQDSENNAGQVKAPSFLVSDLMIAGK